MNDKINLLEFEAARWLVFLAAGIFAALTFLRWEQTFKVSQGHQALGFLPPVSFMMLMAVITLAPDYTLGFAIASVIFMAASIGYDIWYFGKYPIAQYRLPPPPPHYEPKVILLQWMVAQRDSTISERQGKLIDHLRVPFLVVGACLFMAFAWYRSASLLRQNHDPAIVTSTQRRIVAQNDTIIHTQNFLVAELMQKDRTDSLHDAQFEWQKKYSTENRAMITASRQENAYLIRQLMEQVNALKADVANLTAAVLITKKKEKDYTLPESRVQGVEVPTAPTRRKKQ